MDFNQQLLTWAQRANDVLSRCITPLPFQNTPLVDAMAYGALLGGKRLRPFLVYSTGTMLGTDLAVRLTTDVALEQDGSAHVTQIFSANTDEGTEFYMDRLTSGGLTYANFAVSDENGPYVTPLVRKLATENGIDLNLARQLMREAREGLLSDKRYAAMNVYFDVDPL